MTTNEPTPLTAEEAVERALLHTFQLSDKDYRKMQRALSEVVFIRTLEQDGYTVAALDAARAQREPELAALDVERLARAMSAAQYTEPDDAWGLVRSEVKELYRRQAAAIVRQYAALAQPAPDADHGDVKP